MLVCIYMQSDYYPARMQTVIRSASTATQFCDKHLPNNLNCPDDYNTFLLDLSLKYFPPDSALLNKYLNSRVVDYEFDSSIKSNVSSGHDNICVSMLLSLCFASYYSIFSKHS